MNWDTAFLIIYKVKLHIFYNNANSNIVMMKFLEMTMKKNKYLRNIGKYVVLFLIGGLGYYCIEVVNRGYSHWSMFLCGGACFVMTGMINQALGFEVSLVSQMIIAGIIITELEFITGSIVNLWMKWDVWDYSEVPYNILGQICLPYSLLWIGLSVIAILLDDYLRYRLFGERKATYKIF